MEAALKEAKSDADRQAALHSQALRDLEAQAARAEDDVRLHDKVQINEEVKLHASREADARAAELQHTEARLNMSKQDVATEAEVHEAALNFAALKDARTDAARGAALLGMAVKGDMAKQDVATEVEVPEVALNFAALKDARIDAARGAALLGMAVKGDMAKQDVATEVEVPEVALNFAALKDARIDAARGAALLGMAVMKATHDAELSMLEDTIRSSEERFQSSLQDVKFQSSREAHGRTEELQEMEEKLNQAMEDLASEAAMAAKMRPIVEDADAAVNTTPGPPSKTPSFAEAIDDIQSNLEQAKQQVASESQRAWELELSLHQAKMQAADEAALLKDALKALDSKLSEAHAEIDRERTRASDARLEVAEMQYQAQQLAAMKSEARAKALQEVESHSKKSASSLEDARLQVAHELALRTEAMESDVLSQKSSHAGKKDESPKMPPTLKPSRNASPSSRRSSSRPRRPEQQTPRKDAIEAKAPSSQNAEHDGALVMCFPSAPWPPPDEFDAELLKSLTLLGATCTADLSVKLREGSIVADVYGPHGALQELMRLPIKTHLVVHGFQVGEVRLAGPKLGLPADEFLPALTALSARSAGSAASRRPPTARSRAGPAAESAPVANAAPASPPQQPPASAPASPNKVGLAAFVNALFPAETLQRSPEAEAVDTESLANESGRQLDKMVVDASPRPLEAEVVDSQSLAGASVLADASASALASGLPDDQLIEQTTLRIASAVLDPAAAATLLHHGMVEDSFEEAGQGSGVASQADATVMATTHPEGESLCVPSALHDMASASTDALGTAVPTSPSPCMVAASRGQDLDSQQMSPSAEHPPGGHTSPPDVHQDSAEEEQAASLHHRAPSEASQAEGAGSEVGTATAVEEAMNAVVLGVEWNPVEPSPPEAAAVPEEKQSEEPELSPAEFEEARSLARSSLMAALGVSEPELAPAEFEEARSMARSSLMAALGVSDAASPRVAAEVAADSEARLPSRSSGPISKVTVRSLSNGSACAAHQALAEVLPVVSVAAQEDRQTEASQVLDTAAVPEQTGSKPSTQITMQVRHSRTPSELGAVDAAREAVESLRRLAQPSRRGTADRPPRATGMSDSTARPASRTASVVEDASIRPSRTPSEVEALLTAQEAVRGLQRLATKESSQCSRPPRAASKESTSSLPRRLSIASEVKMSPVDSDADAECKAVASTLMPKVTLQPLLQLDPPPVSPTATATAEVQALTAAVAQPGISASRNASLVGGSSHSKGSSVACDSALNLEAVQTPAGLSRGAASGSGAPQLTVSPQHGSRTASLVQSHSRGAASGSGVPQLIVSPQHGSCTASIVQSHSRGAASGSGAPQLTFSPQHGSHTASIVQSHSRGAASGSGPPQLAVSPKHGSRTDSIVQSRTASAVEGFAHSARSHLDSDVACQAAAQGLQASRLQLVTASDLGSAAPNSRTASAVECPSARAGASDLESPDAERLMAAEAMRKLEQSLFRSA